MRFSVKATCISDVEGTAKVQRSFRPRVTSLLACLCIQREDDEDGFATIQLKINNAVVAFSFNILFSLSPSERSNISNSINSASVNGILF